MSEIINNVAGPFINEQRWEFGALLWATLNQWLQTCLWCTSIHTKFTSLQHWKYQPKKLHNFSFIFMCRCLCLRWLTCCIGCPKVSLGGKSCCKLLGAQKVAQNSKSYHKVAKHNLYRPITYS